MAMEDAMRLTEAIVSAQKIASERQISEREALTPLLETYETEMFARASDIAKETEQLLGAMYGSDNGAEDMLAFFKEVLLAGQGQDGAQKPLDN